MAAFHPLPAPIASPGQVSHSRATTKGTVMKRILLGLVALTIAQPLLATQENWVKVVEEREGYGPPVTGADWVQIATDDGGSVYFIDRSSIRTKGLYLTAWEKQDHRADPSVNSREALALHLYDCAAKTAAMMEVHVYRADGSHEGRIFTDAAKDLSPVKPRTIGVPLLDYVCAQRARK